MSCCYIFTVCTEFVSVVKVSSELHSVSDNIIVVSPTKAKMRSAVFMFLCVKLPQ
jgi:hypothetical protein